jgi:hypothetical protein
MENLQHSKTEILCMAYASQQTQHQRYDDKEKLQCGIQRLHQL